MISTRRIVAAVGLAAGLTGLAAPPANAADATAPDAGRTNPMATLDSLTASDLPVERKAELPRPSARLQQLNRLRDLGRQHQITDLPAPVTGLL